MRFHLAISSPDGLDVDDWKSWRDAGAYSVIVPIGFLPGLGGPSLPEERVLATAAKVRAAGLQVFIGIGLTNYWNKVTPLVDWRDDNGWTDLCAKLTAVGRLGQAANAEGFYTDGELYPQDGGVSEASWSLRGVYDPQLVVRRAAQFVGALRDGLDGRPVNLIDYWTINHMPGTYGGEVYQLDGDRNGGEQWWADGLIASGANVVFADALFQKTTNGPLGWPDAVAHACDLFRRTAQARGWHGSVGYAAMPWYDQQGTEPWSQRRPIEEWRAQIDACSQFVVPGLNAMPVLFVLENTKPDRSDPYFQALLASSSSPSTPTPSSPSTPTPSSPPSSPPTSSSPPTPTPSPSSTPTSPPTPPPGPLAEFHAAMAELRSVLGQHIHDLGSALIAAAEKLLRIDTTDPQP